METTENCLFILRGWSEGGEWRWSLQENGKSDRLGFPDLDSLYLYLASLAQASAAAGEKRSGSMPE